MRLLYSKPKNVPYIELDDGSKLIFASLLEDKNKGFQHLAFSGKFVTEYSIGNGNGKTKKGKRTVDVGETVSFATDLKLTSLDKRVKSKNGPLNPTVAKKLRKLFAEHSEGGWITRDGIKSVEGELNNG